MEYALHAVVVWPDSPGKVSKISFTDLPIRYLATSGSSLTYTGYIDHKTKDPQLTMLGQEKG